MTELSWFEDYGANTYQGYDLSRLKIDEAYLSINLPLTPKAFYLYRRHQECLKCPFVHTEQLKDDLKIVDGAILILTDVPQNIYRISTDNVTHLESSKNYICEFGQELGEFGVYVVDNITTKSCSLQVLKRPISTVFPVLSVFLLYLALFLFCLGVILLWKKTMKKSQTSKPKKDIEKQRVKSLDTFRGISIVIMIFVNYGAGGYKILEHAAWNGLHFADLVFPWFMWIMGACIPISLMSSFKRKTPKSEILYHVLLRSIKLFCLGIFLGSGSVLEYLRIFGVLQRFGICYLVVTTICVFTMRRNPPKSNHKIGKYFMDLNKVLASWIVVLSILCGYLLILFLLADEGCSMGYLGPGGLHDHGKHFNCTGGATGLVDKFILGNHRYQSPTSKSVYLGTQAFDPEGILGCLPSVVHVFIGVQAGVTLLTYKDHSDRLVRWLSWSIITGVIGGVLCGFSKEDGLIPVNKNLWSLSFVMVTSCFAFLLLSVCYVLIDVKQWWSGKPFLFAGMNAILMYIGHEMTYGHFPIRWTVYQGKDHGTHFIALFENLWGTGFWVLVAFYLYKIKYFFTL